MFVGTRSLLYLRGHADTGLNQSLLMTTLGLVIGLLLGGIITHLYDRKGFHRIQGAAELAIAMEHQAQYARQTKRERPGEAETESPSEQT